MLELEVLDNFSMRVWYRRCCVWVVLVRVVVVIIINGERFFSIESREVLYFLC